jgi:hypothetical protein
MKSRLVLIHLFVCLGTPALVRRSRGTLARHGLSPLSLESRSSEVAYHALFFSSLLCLLSYGHRSSSS